MKKPEHFIKKWTTVLKVTKPSAQSFLKTDIQNHVDTHFKLFSYQEMGREASPSQIGQIQDNGVQGLEPEIILRIQLLEY